MYQLRKKIFINIVAMYGRGRELFRPRGRELFRPPTYITTQPHLEGRVTFNLTLGTGDIIRDTVWNSFRVTFIKCQFGISRLWISSFITG